jgi:hypothetical protein
MYLDRSTTLLRFFPLRQKYEKFEDAQEAINLKTDNTMTKRKRTKEQTMMYKTLNRKLKIEKHEPH